MHVFISWSGDRSKAVATAFKTTLEDTIQLAEPWMSPDTGKGATWGKEIQGGLEKASFGVICVTAENREAPWLLFEAGAISKNEGRVATLLLDLKPTDVTGPPTLFQATDGSSKEDVFRLFKDIAAGPPGTDKPLVGA